jgi:hypothetical protein
LVDDVGRGLGWALLLEAGVTGSDEDQAFVLPTGRSRSC